MKRINSFTKAYFNYFLFSNGVIENPTYKYVEYLISLVITINFCVFAFGVYIGLTFNELDLVEKIVVLKQCVGFLFTLILHFVMTFKRNNLVQIKQYFCYNDVGNLEQKIELITEKRFRKFAVIFTIVTAVLYTSYIIPIYSITMKFIGDEESTNADARNYFSTFLLPFPKWYECHVNVDYEAFLRYFCWNVDNYGQLVLKISLMFVTGLFCLIAEHGILLLLVLISINLNVRLTTYESQLEKSFEKIKNIHDPPSDNVDGDEALGRNNLNKAPNPDRMVESKNAYRLEYYNRISECELKKFIRNYQYYYRIIAPVLPVMNGISNSVMCSFFPLLCFSIFTLVMAERTSVSYYDFMNFITTIFILVLIATVCYVSEEIKNLNDKVSNLLYNVPWYNFPIKSRKLLLVLLTMLKSDNSVSFLSMYRMDVPRFTTLLKTLYSTVNLLRAKYSYK